MIKFRCPQCNQKLGVPDEYAGKRVRCTRCKEPAQIPQLEVPVAEEIVLEDIKMADEDFGAGDGSSENVWGDLDEMQQVDSQEAERMAAIAKARAPQSKVSTVSVGPAGGKSSGSSAAAALVGEAGRVPLAILAAILLPLGGGIIWGLIAKLTGFIFCWGAVPIACLAAFGLTKFIDSRNVGIGLLAALFGFVGIIEGKICIAKMATLDVVQEMVDTEFIGAMQEEQLTDEDIDEMLQEDWPLFAVATIYLMEDGQFEQEFVGEIFKANIMDEYPEEMADELEAADEQVNEMIDNWSEAEQRQMLKDKWPSVVANSTQLFMDSKVGSVLAMGLAFIGSFALWDLLFIPMGLWSAYKIGDGRE